MKIHIWNYVDKGPDRQSVDVEMPAVPALGSYVSHEPSGIYGYVDAINWYWPEDGSDLIIDVKLK